MQHKSGKGIATVGSRREVPGVADDHLVAHLPEPYTRLRDPQRYFVLLTATEFVVPVRVWIPNVPPNSRPLLGMFDRSQDVGTELSTASQ